MTNSQELYRVTTLPAPVIVPGTKVFSASEYYDAVMSGCAMPETAIVIDDSREGCGKPVA